MPAGFQAKFQGKVAYLSMLNSQQAEPLRKMQEGRGNTE
jgi:hypothetical protein